MKLFGLEIRKARPQTEERFYTQFYNPTSTIGGLYYQNSSAMCLSAVYRATEIISDTMAMLPIQVKSTNDKHTDVMPNHRLSFIFKNGIETMSYYNFMKLLIQSVILHGNGFAYIERGSDGSVVGLRYLRRGEVTINYEPQTMKLSYSCNYVKGKIDKKDMIHLVKNSYDGVNGIPVLEYAKRTIGISDATENAANNYFENGCNLAGIINVEGRVRDEQKDDIRKNFTTSMANGGGGLLGVLEGNMKYQQIQTNNKDSQMLESRQYNVQDIARFFGISPILLGDLTHVSYNSIEAAQQEFLLHTLQPYITMVEAEFNRKLIGANEQFEIDLDETYILKTDKQAMAEYYSKLLDKGVLCIDEVRVELGYGEIGATQHMIPYTDVEMNTVDNKDKKNTEDE